MVEALLNEDPDDAVQVEKEVSAAHLLVADDGEEGLELCRLREGVYR